MNVDPMLYPGVLRYFRAQLTAPIPELARHETEFPGCSTALPPWPERKTSYRAIPNLHPSVGARGPARRRVLTATIGRGTFAHYMPTTATWEIIVGKAVR